MSQVREPAVAGRFYPGAPDELRDEVERLLASAGRSAGPAVAAMAPHAGYVFSGPVAAEVFASIQVPDTVILLGPNHTGLGPRVSVYGGRAWRMPWGEVPVATELARELADRLPGAQADADAHLREHAIEVELPFLCARRPDVEIVPVVLADLSETEALELGRALFEIIGDRDLLVVASSDMSHYLPEDEARRVDRVALEPLLAFDAAGLYRTVRDHRITMCGVLPATAMLAYAERAGARDPELLGYATSADASGDTSRVVGYAGVILGAGDGGAR